MKDRLRSATVLTLASAFGLAFACGGGVDLLRVLAWPRLWRAVLSPEVALIAAPVGAASGFIGGFLLSLHGRPLKVAAAVLFPAYLFFIWLLVLVADDSDVVAGLKACAVELDRTGTPGWQIRSVTADSGDGCADVAAEDGIRRCCEFSGAWRGNEDLRVECFGCDGCGAN